MAITDKHHWDIDARFRSLLQKAVRRGDVDLVFTTSAILESLSSKEKNWFRNQTAIVTFEECWPLGTDLVFNRKFHSKVAALVKVTRSKKAKDATGLGFLAYALSEGDRSVLTGSAEDRHIRIVSNAVRRPDEFWNWVDQIKTAACAKILVENAHRFRQAGLARDRAVIQAAAYLAVIGDIPPVELAAQHTQAFPYWVALDMHTPQGRRVLKDVARDLHIPLKQLEWTLFYFEGAQTNDSAMSIWWERSCNWYFQKIGLPMEEAHLIWEPARVQVIEALSEDSRQLHRDLYTWKLTNREGVEGLKKQVELFISHFDSGQMDQLELF
ncbi:MAG: hypothetical protein AMJ54_03090 [Deltaproteobacteria bacterium SG8_13]|nr:MAG: hypothetical protein AMJ54_03090 [Deltaproteobacteria bacterium SG8_13]